MSTSDDEKGPGLKKCDREFYLAITRAVEDHFPSYEEWERELMKDHKALGIRHLTVEVKHETSFSRLLERLADRPRRSIRRPTQRQTAEEVPPIARIVRPPGTWAERIFGSVMTMRAYRVRVLVVISEMRAEYFEELAAGNKWKAEWVRARGHYLIFKPWLEALLPRLLRKFLIG